MVHGGGRGVRGSLQGAVIGVVKVKLVTDVTEQSRRRKLLQVVLFLKPERGKERRRRMKRRVRRRSRRMKRRGRRGGGD